MGSQARARAGLRCRDRRRLDRRFRRAEHQFAEQYEPEPAVRPRGLETDHQALEQLPRCAVSVRYDATVRSSRAVLELAAASRVSKRRADHHQRLRGPRRRFGQHDVQAAYGCAPTGLTLRPRVSAVLRGAASAWEADGSPAGSAHSFSSRPCRTGRTYRDHVLTAGCRYEF